MSKKINFKLIFIAFEEFNRWNKELKNVKDNITEINAEIKDIKFSIQSLTSIIEKHIKK